MTSPFQDALREQLRAAAIRDLQRAPRRRWRRIGAAAVAVVAAVVGAVALLSPSPAGADVEVRIEDGFVEVRLTDLDATPREVEAAMRDRDLEVEVVRVPVGPSLVGRFLGVQVPDVPGRPVETFREEGVGFQGFRVPLGWPGELVVQLGSKAAPGEDYGVGSDAFADDEPLHCEGVQGSTLAAARGALGDLSVRVLPEGFIGGPFALDAPEATEYSSWFIVAARTFSADAVLVQLSEAPPPREEGC